MGNPCSMPLSFSTLQLILALMGCTPALPWRLLPRIVTPGGSWAWVLRGALSPSVAACMVGVSSPDHPTGSGGNQRTRARNVLRSCRLCSPTRQVHRRLRTVVTRLIIVGHHLAQARPQPGKLWRTWRAPQSLRMPLAIGRVSLTQGEAPYALGVEIPFWLIDRIHWHWVVPLLRRYDALRVCCAPWLLRLPGVGAAVQAALARLERAVSALTTAVR